MTSPPAAVVLRKAVIVMTMKKMIVACAMCNTSKELLQYGFHGALQKKVGPNVLWAEFESSVIHYVINSYNSHNTFKRVRKDPSI